MSSRWLPLLTFGAAIVVWQLGVDGLNVPRYLLPSPLAVAGELARDPGLVARHLAVTTIEALVGLVLAFLVATIVGIVIASSRLAGRLIYPYLVIVQVTPIVAIAPLLIIWLGTGLAPKIAIAFLIAFFPLVVGIAVGLGSAPPDALDLMRSLGATAGRTYRSLRVPNGLPYLFASLRVAVPASVVGAIVGEMVGSDQGLGFLVVRSKGTLDTELLFVAICAAAALGIVLFSVVVAVERTVLWWHPSHRQSRAAGSQARTGSAARSG
jgi:NitT/TauT family transport system permease protein